MDLVVTLLGGVGQTVAITVVSFLVGALLGLPLALARRSARAAVRLPAVAVIEVLRSVPPIVWLFLAYYAVGNDVVQLSTFEAAVVGLGLIAAAYLAEIYRAGLDAVPTGQWEAAATLGLPARVAYRRVVGPQAVAVVIPPAATFAIGLLKDSAVASVIGAQDVTFLAFQESQATLEGLTIFLVAGAIYLVLSAPVAGVARLSGRLLVARVAAR